MFFRWRQVSFTALLLILLLQLVFSPLLLSLNLGQKDQSIADNKGSFTPKNEPFFVGQRPISLWPISQKTAQPHQYPALARDLKRVTEASPEAAKLPLVSELKQNIQKELDVAKQSGAPLLRRLEYENWLQQQVQQIDPNPSFKEKTLGAVNSILISAGSVFSDKEDSAEPTPKETILIPEKPSTFKFSDTEVKVQTLTPPHTSQVQAKPRTLASIFKQAKQAFVDLWRASPVLAQEQSNLPAVADVKADDGEVITDSSIESLAAELNYNPVAITNYVRSNVKYEPYFGAQKGAGGCLRQLVCNDTDTASLTIALLRASGVPARYKHSFVRMPVGQLKTMLGVDQVKTVYVALTIAGLSPKLVNTSIPSGTSIDAVDIESETQLALEWTWVEAYLEYDERGGNISFASTKDAVDGLADDASLRAYLTTFPKKQWLSIEPLLNRSMTRVRNAIAADSAGIDAKQFWLNYYQYQGASAPIAKFLADINNSANSSLALTAGKSNYDILPPSLPYNLVASADNNAAITILTAPYSTLPTAWRQTVVITLKSQDGSQIFLDKTFYASEINNQAVYLRYNGATQTDADVIASYGGLASTPAPLVQIVPYLEFAGNLQSGTIPFHIGDTLVLETKLTANGAVIHDSQKFSIAGNEEGVFIAFSSIAPDANLDNLNESGLLAQGTAALARKYLQHLTASRDTLSGALDYTANFRFMRAVVTQNRALNVFSGYPTTFDFSGLTMDAATDVNDYSRRDNYKNHRDHFRLVFGLEASRYEGQLFTDVAGLDGIATVSGLQYAYAHPETYTVHTITSANQGEIAGLNVSPNVKAQITAGVAAGATAVVPDKNIVKGNFQGILYALLNADGTGEYAIGEQVANGGYTSDHYEIINVLIGGQLRAQFINRDQNNPDNFIYADQSANTADKICRISKITFLAIANNEAWQESYGLPCLKETHSFGTHDYTFIMTLNAAKFKSVTDNFSYWKTDENILTAFQLKFSDAGITAGKLYPYWGTYVYDNWKLRWNGDKTGAIIGLGVYNPNQQNVYELPFKMREKYIADDLIQNKYVPNLLGYPKMDMIKAGLSPRGQAGYYQQFTNGTMYWDAMLPTLGNPASLDVLPGKVYITYGIWDVKHNQLNGTTGIGFPMTDVGFDFTYNATVQKFETSVCSLNVGNSTIGCQSRTLLQDLQSGYDKIFESTGIIFVAYNLYRNNQIIHDYQIFLNGIDSADNSYLTKYTYCNLFHADEIRAISVNSVYNQALCFIPQSIAYYRSQKSAIQSRLANLIAENNQEIYLAQLLQDEINTQISGASFTPTEWLGYLSVDIATTILGPAMEIGATAAKDVALRVAERYAVEISSKRVARDVLVKQVEKEIAKEITTLGADVTEEILETKVEKSLLKGLKDAGLPAISRKGIKNIIDVSIDVAKRLPDVYFDPTPKNRDIIEAFARHYEKHVLEELPAVGRPIVSQAKYLDDSISFFTNYTGEKQIVTLGDGKTSGYLIRQQGLPGGYFTLDGKVVTYWYY